MKNELKSKCCGRSVSPDGMDYPEEKWRCNSCGKICDFETSEPQSETPRTDALFACYKCDKGFAIYEPNDGSIKFTEQHGWASEATVQDWADVIGDLTDYDLIPCQRYVSKIERELGETNKKIERYHDLVRYQRAELHQADLITDDEYAALLSDSKSVARLEGYDKLQQELAQVRGELEETKQKLSKFKGHRPLPVSWYSTEELAADKKFVDIFLGNLILHSENIPLCDALTPYQHILLVVRNHT